MAQEKPKLRYGFYEFYENENVFVSDMLCIGQVIGNSVAFALGLATTLALLGVAASFAGKAYGQVGQGLPLAASGLAIIMGLNLLEVVRFTDHLEVNMF